MPGPVPVWFVMPSANASNAARCVPAWRDMGYRVAILQDSARFEIDCDALLIQDKYPGWAGSINTLCRDAVPVDCPVIVAGGDDMYPDPDQRAHEIADQFLDHFGGSFGVMQPTGDDYEATRIVCGSPWLGRAWFERMYSGQGGLCEAYYQQWADDELHWVSRCAGRLWDRPDLTQHHDHFLRAGRPAPSYWVASAADHDEHDCLTFIARGRAGFPGAAPLDEPGLLDLSVFSDSYTGRAEAIYRERHGGSDTEPERRLTRALARCAVAGDRRVLIYGAGLHTRRAGGALRDPPVEILGIVDDDPDRVGRRLWNYRVISPEQAALMRADSVVISSDAMESVLVERARTLEALGVRIETLYASPGAARIGA